MLTRMQTIRITLLEVRARSALAMAASAKLPLDRRRHILTSAERDLRDLERENMVWSNPYAPLYRAGMHFLRGNADEAARELATAESGFRAADMALHATLARRRR